MNKNLIFQQLYEAQSSTFTYLLADSNTKEAVLIDTVIESVDRDLKLIEELGLKLLYVLDTHIHADHVTAAGEIRKRLGIKTAVPKKASVPCADLNLSEGDEIRFGQFVIKVLETPGHTDASLSFYCEGMVFSGDALLIRGNGRTDFQSGSSSELFDSIHQKLFKLPVSTLLYPAHDYKGFTSSTIEMEIKHNPRVGSGKTKEQFMKIMSELNLAYPKQIDVALPANIACGSQTTASSAGKSIKNISAIDLQNRLDEVLVIDVRNPDEFTGELGHIKGSHLISLGDQVKQFLQGYNRSEEIVFVCRSGKRSTEASGLAIELGFEKISNLDGGMQRWTELNLPVER